MLQSPSKGGKLCLQWHSFLESSTRTFDSHHSAVEARCMDQSNGVVQKLVGIVIPVISHNNNGLLDTSAVANSHWRKLQRDKQQVQISRLNNTGLGSSSSP